MGGKSLTAKVVPYPAKKVVQGVLLKCSSTLFEDVYDYDTAFMRVYIMREGPTMMLANLLLCTA